MNCAFYFSFESEGGNPKFRYLEFQKDRPEPLFPIKPTSFVLLVAGVDLNENVEDFVPLLHGLVECSALLFGFQSFDARQIRRVADFRDLQKLLEKTNLFEGIGFILFPS